LSNTYVGAVEQLTIIWAKALEPEAEAPAAARPARKTRNKTA